MKQQEVNEQQSEIPHRGWLPSSCTLPGCRQRESGLPAMPVIVWALVSSAKSSWI